MKRTVKKWTGIALSVSLLLSAVVSAAPVVSATSHTVMLNVSGTVEASGNRPILQQYACHDGNYMKLLDGRTLYRYDTAADTFTVEYTFPEQEEINEDADQYGSVRIFNGVKSAYVNEHTGKLYFAYDKYRMFNKREGMAVQVITYDLEQAQVTAEMTVAGENLMSVGADDSGRIFLATRAQFAEYGNPTALYVYSAGGSKLAQKTVANPIDTFCGFAANGKFFFSETKYTQLANNRFRADRSMRSGVFGSGSLTLHDTFGSLNYYYNQPAKLLDGGYFANYTTRLYDTQTNAVTDYFAGTQASDPQSYYANHATANTVVHGGVAYVLRDNHKIMGYDLNTKLPAAVYQTDDHIFSMIECSDGVMLLLKNGSVYSYRHLPFNGITPVQEVEIDLNEQSVYQRTPAEIVQHFAQAVPADYDAPFYTERGSADAPYKEFTLTEETKGNIVRAANFYRWLEGLSGFDSAESDTWSMAAKGAVLTDKSVRLTHVLSHTPDRPDDMDEAFYADAFMSTSNSNIAFGFSDGQHAILDLLRGFLNDEGYAIPGHRDTFMTRNGDSFAAGYTDYGAVNTIEVSGDPNPQGYSALGNNQAAYAWPTPGYFPEEEISTTASWTINLNTDFAGLSPVAFYVKITDLQTGEEFVRDSTQTGLYTTNSWGKFISFLPPEADSYSDKSYRVEVFNLANAQEMPVRLTYTVNFFSYEDPVEIDGVMYTADEYGVLTPQITYLLGDANDDSKVTVNDVTAIQRWLADLTEFSEKQMLAADVNKDGLVTIDDVTTIQRYLAEFVAHF